MNHRIVFFADNFFSSGKTDIVTEEEEKVGELDLLGLLSSGVKILDAEENFLCLGKFGFFSSKWTITDASETTIGVLRSRFSFFSKKFEYDSLNRGVYTITSPSLSRNYEVYTNKEHIVAKFEKVSGFFSASNFRLTNYSDQLYLAELIALVMGVNAIQKRQNSGAGSGGGAC